MKKGFQSISTPLGISAKVSISQNLTAFPDVAKRMRICYATIANLFELLDDKNALSEQSFYLIEQHIKKQMDVLDDCLCDVFRDDVEVDRFNRMEKYYHEVRNDAMEHLMSQLDTSCFDINARLEKLFNALSDTINAMDRQYSPKLLNAFYRQMKDIKDILESDKYEEQITILQYQNRGKKYKAAFHYVKNISSHK